MANDPMVIVPSYRTPSIAEACQGPRAQLRFACEVRSPKFGTAVLVGARGEGPAYLGAAYLAHSVAQAQLAVKYPGAFAEVCYGWGTVEAATLQLVYQIRPITPDLVRYHRDEEMLLVQGYKAGRTSWRLTIIDGCHTGDRRASPHTLHSDLQSVTLPELDRRLLARADFQTAERLYDTRTPVLDLEVLLNGLLRGPKDRFRPQTTAWLNAVITQRTAQLGARLG